MKIRIFSIALGLILIAGSASSGLGNNNTFAQAGERSRGRSLKTDSERANTLDFMSDAVHSKLVQASSNRLLATAPRWQRPLKYLPTRVARLVFYERDVLRVATAHRQGVPLRERDYTLDVTAAAASNQQRYTAPYARSVDGPDREPDQTPADSAGANDPPNIRANVTGKHAIEADQDVAPSNTSLLRDTIQAIADYQSRSIHEDWSIHEHGTSLERQAQKRPRMRSCEYNANKIATGRTAYGVCDILQPATATNRVRLKNQINLDWSATLPVDWSGYKPYAAHNRSPMKRDSAVHET